jgi:hypothetical protein
MGLVKPGVRPSAVVTVCGGPIAGTLGVGMWPCIAARTEACGAVPVCAGAAPWVVYEVAGAGDMSAPSAFIHACSNTSSAATSDPKLRSPLGSRCLGRPQPLGCGYCGRCLNRLPTPHRLAVQAAILPEKYTAHDQRIGHKPPAPRRPIPVQGISTPLGGLRRTISARWLATLDHSAEALSLTSERTSLTLRGLLRGQRLEDRQTGVPAGAISPLLGQLLRVLVQRIRLAITSMGLVGSDRAALIDTGIARWKCRDNRKELRRDKRGCGRLVKHWEQRGFLGHLVQEDVQGFVRGISGKRLVQGWILRRGQNGGVMGTRRRNRRPCARRGPTRSPRSQEYSRRAWCGFYSGDQRCGPTPAHHGYPNSGSCSERRGRVVGSITGAAPRRTHGAGGSS